MLRPGDEVITDQRGTLRLDDVGSVARAFTVEEVDYLAPAAAQVAASLTPALSLLYPIHLSLAHGANPRRARAAGRSLGQIIVAFAVMIAIDARCPHCRVRVHDALRALPPEGIDALDDMLANFPAARPLLEAERMFRANMLADDWRLDLEPELRDGRVVATVRARAREGIASA